MHSLQENADTRNVTGHHIQNRIRLVAVLFLAAIISAVDFFTKTLWFGTEKTFSSFSPIFMRLAEHRNTGLIFDITVPSTALLLLHAIAILTLLTYFIRHKPIETATQIAGWSLIFGGATSNFVDRWMLGFVRDWLLFFNMSAINLADISIFLGIIFLSEKFLCSNLVKK